MDENERTDVIHSRGSGWRILGVPLLIAVGASWFVWGPLGIVFYLGGLFNWVSVFVMVLPLFLLILLAAITRLSPKTSSPGVRVRADDRGRLIVRLPWGGGFIGHWGIEIGDATMEKPSSDGYYECRRFAPGAYVWHDLD
jgi:hypothetical protein